MKAESRGKKNAAPKFDVAAIDIIVNLWTPEANRVRPQDFEYLITNAHPWAECRRGVLRNQADALAPDVLDD